LIKKNRHPPSLKNMKKCSCYKSSACSDFATKVAQIGYLTKIHRYFCSNKVAIKYIKVYKIKYKVTYMEYSCECCKYKTNKRFNYDKHLLSKKHLLLEEISKSQPKVYSESTESQQVVIPKSTQIAEKVAIVFTCKYCEQNFKFKQSMYRHIKYTCTKNKDEDLTELVRLLNLQLEQQKQEFTKKIETQSKQIEKLMGKLEIHGSFNTTNIQNINLLAYRETDVSHLTDQDYKSCLKKVNHCVKHMIEKVHFNPTKPENMNIYISNIKDKYIMVYDGMNWNLANKKEEIDRLYEEKEMMLEEWLDSNPEKELKDKFLKYLNNKESDECLNRIKDEIKLMLYNNQNRIELKSVV